MNRKRAFLILFLGLVSGLVATVWAYKNLSDGNRAPSQSASSQLEAIVRMKDNVAQGDEITKEHIEIARLPASLVPEKAVRKIEEVAGRVALFDLSKGEPVLLTKLAPPGSPRGLAAKLAPGMRAMTIRVNEVIGVAGFIMAGSRVDVLVTLDPDEKAGGGGTISKVVLQNVEVLAVGQNPDPKDTKATKASVVTLAVTPAQAEALSLAATKGSIFLTLRNTRDDTSPDTPGISPPQLVFGDAPKAKGGGDVPKRGPAREDGVEIIRGVKKSLEGTAK